MKEIIFGIAVGSIIGVLLYKNNDCAKEMFNQGEKIIKKEIDMIEKNMTPSKKTSKAK